MKVYRHKDNGEYYTLLDKTEKYVFLAPLFINYKCYVEDGDIVIAINYSDIDAWVPEDLYKYFEYIDKGFERGNNANV